MRTILIVNKLMFFRGSKPEPSIFSGEHAMPALVRVNAKQLFSGTGCNIFQRNFRRSGLEPRTDL